MHPHRACVPAPVPPPPPAPAAAAASVRVPAAQSLPSLPQIESYFLQDASQLQQPLNLRNEAAAVSLLLGHWGAQAAGGEWHRRLGWPFAYCAGACLFPLVHASEQLILQRACFR